MTYSRFCPKTFFFYTNSKRSRLHFFLQAAPFFSPRKKVFRQKSRYVFFFPYRLFFFLKRKNINHRKQQERTEEGGKRVHLQTPSKHHKNPGDKKRYVTFSLSTPQELKGKCWKNPGGVAYTQKGGVAYTFLFFKYQRTHFFRHSTKVFKENFQDLKKYQGVYLIILVGLFFFCAFKFSKYSVSESSDSEPEKRFSSGKEETSLSSQSFTHL